MTRGRLLIRTVLYLVIALVVLAAATVLVLQTSWAKDYLRALAERRASAALNAQVSIGELKGSLLFGATVADLAVTRHGERLAAIDEVVAEYDAFDFLRGQFDLERIVVERPVLEAEALGAFGGFGGPRRGGDGRSFTIGEIVIRDGKLTIGSKPAEVSGFRVPDVIHDLDASLSVVSRPDGTRVAIDRLSFVGQAPAVTLRHLSGTITLADGDLRLDDINVQLAESSFEFGGTIADVGRLGDL